MNSLTGKMGMDAGGLALTTEIRSENPWNRVVDGAYNSRSDSHNGGAAWNSPSRLTLSFAPDGTQLSDQTSSLYDTFGHLLTASELERTILSAFQTWSRQSNINIGVVEDSGDEFGIGGLTQGDRRFGDIRIGAAPMSPGVFAIAVPHDEFVSGTWAGDVIFNSNAVWDSVSQLTGVALHEAGHVLGLEHSDNLLSAMHPTALNTSLSPEDITHLQQLYGARQLDAHEFNGQSNDSFQDAVEIRNTGSIDGAVPLVVYGDIDAATDIDFFSIRPNSSYTGSITFRFLSDGISNLNANLLVFDENESLLGQFSGTDVQFQLSSVTPGSDYFIRVESGGTMGADFGSYAIVTTIDDNLTTGQSLIPTIARADLWRLDQGDVQELFFDSQFAINDDLLTNESLATATVLEEVTGHEGSYHYRLQASIAVQADVDFYSFEAGPSEISTIKLVALPGSHLIPQIRLFDSGGSEVATRTLINGNGELTIQANQLIEGNTYFVSVGGLVPDSPFGTGNYTLDIRFDQEQLIYDRLASGNLGVRRQNATDTSTLYVGQTQLFQFALSATASPSLADATIWMEIFDDSGVLVYRNATRPGETRTSRSVVLDPGSYEIRTTLSIPQSQIHLGSIQSGRNISYHIDGIGVSDPTGPKLIDPSDDPFRCKDKDDEFCYPDRPPTTDPFIVVEEDKLNLPPVPRPNWINADLWYWDENWLG